jgi:hypothetical protein
MLRTPIILVEEALIQLEYVLADYYTYSERNHDNVFKSLEETLYCLRITLDSTLSAISRFTTEPEIENIKKVAR